LSSSNSHITLGVATRPLGKKIKDRAKISFSSDNNTFLNAALRLWDNLIHTSNAKEIKKLSISLSSLQVESSQMNFDDFYNHHKKKHQLLSKMIDDLNKKLGSNMVSIGLPPGSVKLSMTAYKKAIFLDFRYEEFSW